MTAQRNNISESPGTRRDRRPLVEVNAETLLQLPEFFTLDLTENAVRLPAKYSYKSPREIEASQMLNHSMIASVYYEKEQKWLKYAAEIVNRSADDTPSDVFLSSFVYHSREEGSVQPTEEITLNAIFPLLFEPPNTPEMQKHCIDLETAAKDVLNPDQKLTVDVSDCPLYALSKQIQFAIEGYDLNSYLPMMGDLHIEQVHSVPY